MPFQENEPFWPPNNYQMRAKNHRNFHLFKKRGGNGVFNADVAVSSEMPEEDLSLGYSGVLIHHYKKSIHRIQHFSSRTLEDLEM